MPDAVVAVPCFNEEKRLDIDAFLAAEGHPSIHWLFVDDGSTDKTADKLQELIRRANRTATVLSLPKNQGKGEAVRRGMLAAMETGAAIVGYLDADLSTPVEEVRRLVVELETRGVAAVFGSRVVMLGTTIERQAVRHYLGRVFATAASLVLRLPVYDTQCGAKLFRSSVRLRRALEMPFLSRWVFDVELIGRFMAEMPGVPPFTPADLAEVPLRCWTHRTGSKVAPLQMVGAGLDLLVVAVELANRRRKRRALSSDQK